MVYWSIFHNTLPQHKDEDSGENSRLVSFQIWDPRTGTPRGQALPLPFTTVSAGLALFVGFRGITGMTSMSRMTWMRRRSSPCTERQAAPFSLWAYELNLRRNLMWAAIATTCAGYRGPCSCKWLSQDVLDCSLTAWGVPGGWGWGWAAPRLMIQQE